MILKHLDCKCHVNCRSNFEATWVCSELWGVEKKPFELLSFNHLGFVA